MFVQYVIGVTYPKRFKYKQAEYANNKKKDF